MDSSTRSKSQGRDHQARGRAKEMMGEITDNPKLKAKGKIERMAGKVQEKIGQTKAVFGK